MLYGVRKPKCYQEKPLILSARSGHSSFSVDYSFSAIELDGSSTVFWHLTGQRRGVNHWSTCW